MKASNIPAKLSEGRENAKDQVSIGVSFTSDWIRMCRECACPITGRSEENPLQSLLSTINENCSHARSTMEILKHRKNNRNIMFSV